MEGLAGCSDRHNGGSDSLPDSGLPPGLSSVRDNGASEEASFNEGLFYHLDFERLHNYTLEDLHTLFTNHEIADIEAYQFSLSDDMDELVSALVDKPLPTYPNEEINKRMLALANNTEVYDDEIEDFLVSDSIVERLMKDRNSSGVRANPEASKRVTRALRVRRSILAHQYVA